MISIPIARSRHAAHGRSIFPSPLQRESKRIQTPCFPVKITGTQELRKISLRQGKVALYFNLNGKHKAPT